MYKDVRKSIERTHSQLHKININGRIGVYEADLQPSVLLLLDSLNKEFADDLTMSADLSTSRRELQLTSVVVFCFDSCCVTTLRSFSSSQSSMLSVCQLSLVASTFTDIPFFLSSRVSSYRLTLSTLRPTFGSCENLHLLPGLFSSGDMHGTGGKVVYLSHNVHS